MPRIKVSAVEWNEANELHATRHGVSIAEIEDVLLSAKLAYRNRRGRSGDFYVHGSTLGGRQVRVVFAYQRDTGTARPIAAWEVDQ